MEPSPPGWGIEHIKVFLSSTLTGRLKEEWPLRVREELSQGALGQPRPGPGSRLLLLRPQSPVALANYFSNHPRLCVPQSLHAWVREGLFG